MSNANDNGPPTWQEQLHEQSYGAEPPPEVEPPYDPGDDTVADVQTYVEANPDQRDAVLKAEKAGKNRTTLVDWLSGS